jgi:hypothetical protein
LDGDGDPDLVMLQFEAMIVSILLNDGEGGFTRGDHSYVAEDPYGQVAVADMDLDGDLDILVSTASNEDYGAIGYLANDGRGTFASPQYTFVNQRADTIAIGDLDADGDLDAFVSSWDQASATLVQNRKLVCAPDEPCPTAPPLPDDFVDCNANLASDYCEVRITSTFPTILVENSTGLEDSYFIGPPDGSGDGISDGIVIYYTGALGVVDGQGPDLNVYERPDYDDFDDLLVEVSDNGVDFVDITASMGDVVRIPGDEAHDDDQAARSFDLAGSGYDFISYIRIDDKSLDDPGLWSGFKLDAVGLIHLSGFNDCNQNELPDDCDIASGTSSDDDQDGVPDECSVG